MPFEGLAFLIKFGLLVWLGALALLTFVCLRRTIPQMRSMLYGVAQTNLKNRKENPSRIQHFLTATGLAILYAVMSLHEMSVSEQPLTSLPDIPEAFLVLLGGSSAIYISNKYLNKK